MRTLIGLGLVPFLVTGLNAQRGTTPVLRGATPSVIYPAGTTAIPGITRNVPSVVNPGGGGVHLVVPGAPGNFNPGLINGQGFHRFNGSNDRSGRGVSYVPYPVYIGGYNDSPYITPQPPLDYQQQPQQNITVVYPPQQQSANPVMMSPYASGASTDGSVVTLPAQPPAQESVEPSYYLLAFKDHTIYSAVAYWVDGDTLHYFTSGNTHNQVSLSLVDRDLTARLNKDSGVEVKLPAPRQ